jgi:hypothetical protein
MMESKTRTEVHISSERKTRIKGQVRLESKTRTKWQKRLEAIESERRGTLRQPV